MAERSMRMRLGLFVAGSLTLLAALVVVFGGTPSLFSNRARYVILFPEAPGVAPGTPVRKSGVRIGEVTGLELDEASGQVRLTVAVDPKHLPRMGEEPVISRGILSGDTALDFVPKTTAEGTPITRGEPYPRGAEIQGTPPVNARTLLSQASGVLPTAQESLVRMSESAQKFERVAPKIEKAAEEFAALSRSAREFVPELRQTNARVQELLGAAEPADPLDPKTEQVTVRQLLRDIRDLLRTLRPAAEELRATLKQNNPELTRTLQSVRQAADAANDVMNPENRKAFAATLRSLQTAGDDLTKTIRLAALLLDQAEKTVKEFNARATQSERAIANLERATRPFAENADQIQRDVSEITKNLNTASVELNLTLAEVRETLKALNRSEGTLQKLVHDPALYTNLNDSAAGVARLLVRLETIARDLEIFADKIARKPETIGVGGALRPSTGLKESPNAPLPDSTPPLVMPIPPTTPIPAYKPPATDRPPQR